MEEQLEPMFAALPKNEHGNLGHAVARYALHRHFIQRHGWSIDGLEPQGDATVAPTGSLERWVPSYLLGKIERLMGTNGINLSELAVLAATFEDLIHKEAIERLKDIYDFMELPTDQGTETDDLEQVIEAYMKLYTSGGNKTVRTVRDLEGPTKASMDKKTKHWLKGVEHEVAEVVCQDGDCEAMDFKSATLMVEMIGERYASFNDNLCQDLKATLLSAEDRKSGRVLLPDFYRVGLHGSWNFEETPEYLKFLGALDDSDAEHPKVVIANYVNSRPNCLAASSIYEICCRNECEELLSSLEESLASSEASPQQIADLVSQISSSTVDAPRELPSMLRQRLDEVAATNSGQVPIHGRLFAQWMHHAFPRECPRPHDKDAVGPQTPDEWMAEVGQATRASQEEIMKVVRVDSSAEVSWSNDEHVLTSTMDESGDQASLLKGVTENFRRGWDEGKLQEYESTLHSMYVALPKNNQGNLDHAVARYALHRLFVEKHGWFIDGLEPLGNAAAAPTGTLAKWAPEQMLREIEKFMGTDGINLHELTVLAASFEDVIHKEAAKRLEDVYDFVGASTDGRLSEEMAAEAITKYMILYTSGGNASVRTIADLKSGRGGLDRKTKAWLRNVQQEVAESESQCDSVTGDCGELDFPAVVRVVEQIGEQYSTFNVDLCTDLKETLLQAEDGKSGRVLLSEFYNVGLHGSWNFTEKPEYLRMLGALDEDDERGPRVIIPNYVGSRPNCLAASSIYEICCQNECEGLMGAVERQIGLPLASVEQILEIVSELSSPTVRAPRVLPDSLVQRLKDSTTHHGKVPIHGRFFAQWMHHAFPRECPRPHGGVGPQTPDEWMKEGTHASKEEVQKIAQSASKTVELPWSSEEKLLHVETPKAKSVHVDKAGLLADLTENLRSDQETDRLESHAAGLRSLFVALPKNIDGNLGHVAARYALHRYFMNKHGWAIDGLEPSGDATELPVGSLERWVPAYILGNIEQIMGTNGLNLHELSVLAATFEDLIHEEITKRLKDVYEVLELPLSEAIDDEDVNSAIGAFMTLYSSGGNTTVRTKDDLLQKRGGLDKPTKKWLHKVQKEAKAKERPCKGKKCGDYIDFDTAARVVERISQQYTSHNQHMCNDLKATLMNVEEGKTGRAPLADFYQQGLHGGWDFSESKEYLRSLGALDESDPQNPRLVIPNYVYSRPNCLAASSVYEVCCQSECESLMAKIEAEVRDSVATPEWLESFMGTLTTSTQRTPRVLPQNLVRRLKDSANSRGRVPLHGRLFAQVMHHAFPRECPQPRQFEATAVQTPDEWMAGETKASEVERKRLASGVTSSVSISWTGGESLLTESPQTYMDQEANILSELMSSFRRGQNDRKLRERESKLQKLFVALPKNEHGNVGHAVARYALHRFFVQQHGWTIDGLEPMGDTSQTPVGTLGKWVPTYILSSIEKLMDTNGISLRELAVLAMTFEDLIHKEASGRLEEVYDVLGLSRTELIDEATAEQAIHAYMALYTSGGNTTVRTRKDLEAKKARLDKKTAKWVSSVQKEVAEAEESCDPTSGRCDKLDFDAATRVAEQIAEQYSAFNEDLCRDLKFTLLNVEDGDTGRVLLKDFYRVGLRGHWNFTETQDYLRILGVLDESDAKSSRVIVPNYVYSRPNCLASSSIYEVCCRNECEDLISHLENEISAPSAKPKRIAQIVAALPSSTMEAPRTLPTSLVKKLDDIARVHGSRVKLHSRLFAQWMHHAFPRECPRPHETGFAQQGPQTPDEWMIEDTRASEEEMLKKAGGEVTLPWDSDMAERVLDLPSQRKSTSGVLGTIFIWPVALAALAIAYAVRHPSILSGKRKGDGILPSYWKSEANRV